MLSLLELCGQSGTRVSPTISLAPVGRVDSSVIVWDETVPAGGSITVETSLNGGSTWQAAVNGAAISGLNSGDDVTGKTLTIRETLKQVVHADVLALHRLIATVTPLPPNLPYYRIPEDFDLGDIVTVQNPAWGKSMDLRVAEIRVILDGASSPRTEISFGAPWPNLIDSVKRAIAQAGPELRR